MSRQGEGQQWGDVVKVTATGSKPPSSYYPQLGPSPPQDRVQDLPPGSLRLEELVPLLQVLAAPPFTGGQFLLLVWFLWVVWGLVPESRLWLHSHLRTLE